MDAEEWDSRRHDSLVAVPGPEGFVHFCDKNQVSFVRESYFPTGSTVATLAIDPTRLDSETRYEPGSGGRTRTVSPCPRSDSAHRRGRLIANTCKQAQPVIFAHANDMVAQTT